MEKKSTFHNPNAKLHVSLFSRGSFGKSTFLGKATIEISSLKEDKVSDCFYDVRSLDPNDKKTYGKIYFLFQKVKDPSLGFLSYYGKPVSAIPQRLDLADLLFFSSKGIVSSATRVATWSKVNTGI